MHDNESSHLASFFFFSIVTSKAFFLLFLQFELFNTIFGTKMNFMWNPNMQSMALEYKGG